MAQQCLGVGDEDVVLPSSAAEEKEQHLALCCCALTALLPGVRWCWEVFLL